MNVFSSKINSLLVLKAPFSRPLSSICPPPPKDPIVTLLDSLSSVGANLALLLKQNPHITELRVYDEEASTYPLAQDLCSIDTRTRIRSFDSKELKKAIQGSHLVISTGGCQCKPGQSQKELFEKNLDSVRNVAMFLAEFNPGAVFCIAKSGVESLVPMASEEYKKAESYDPRKIIGVTTPVSMVANTFIAHRMNKDPGHILCPVIGGMSPQTVVPVISQTRPSVELNPSLYKELQEAIANAEEDLLAKGSMFCFAKAAAISRFVNLVAKGLKGKPNCVECAFVAQTGHIGEFLPYMTSIVKLGTEGVESTHMPRVNEAETSCLKAAAPHILQNIILGQTFLQGDFCLPSHLKTKRKCNEALKKKVQECNMRMGVQ